MKTSRDDIVERAFPVFLGKGFDGATMADLVASSGLSKGAFYHYFRDKQALFDACIERFFIAFLPAPEDAPESFDDAVRVMAEGYAAALVRAREACGEPAAYLRFVLAMLPARRPALVALIGQGRDGLAALYRREHPQASARLARVEADRMLALIEGIGVLAAVVDDPDPAACFRRLLPP